MSIADHILPLGDLFGLFLGTAPKGTKSCRILPEFKKTQVFPRIVQIGLYFTTERHFEGKLGFLELLSIKFESFGQ